MLKSSLLFFVFILSGFSVFAKTASDFQTTEDILAVVHTEKPTNCASAVFSQALIDHSNEISETDDEARVRVWARETMQNPDVLEQILECPEIKTIADDTTIIFTPIVYEFKDADNNTIRTITVNYSTQPKVIKQKILLSRKRSLPNGDINPNLMDFESGAKYLNTEPAWYAIMVVQHDALKDFVGPGRNNTLSMKYINDHIDEIYPHGYYCTSKSAIANNHDTINRVVKQVVDIEDDTNDYYVAGNVNLEWVMYAEIAADALIFAATTGGGAAAMRYLKNIRSFRTGKNIIKNMYELEKIDKVKDYVTATKTVSKHTADIAKLEKNIENARKYEKALENIENARKAGRSTTKYEKEAEEILEAARKIDPIELTQSQAKSLADIDKNIARYEKQIADLQGKNPSKARELRTKIADQKYTRNKILNQAENKSIKLDANKLREEIKTLQEDVKKAEKEAEELLKTNEDVQKYKKQADTYKDLHTYFRELNALRLPQTGNVITKSLNVIKSIHAVNNGAKTMTKAGRVARAGMSSRSAKIKDFLLDATLKHGARLARVERDIGLVYGAIEFLGDMYDKTSTTSKEFSNGIEFKPLCLLSADDLKGQENVVNYGMWLMWMGNSTDMADDDAAYLQAMDFAAKFFYQLDEYQDEHGANCNIDIYVVRPIIRLDETNVDNPSGELFYLFMNEIPWSTAEQFGDSVPNITEWDRAQKQLNEQDPEQKYTKQNPEYSEQTPERIATNENTDLSEQDNAE